MKKIRLGNDIHIIWVVTGAQGLSESTLAVTLLNKHDEAVTFIPSIDVDQTGKCTIDGTFAGRNQKTTGTYRLLLQVNNGKQDMMTLDHIEVFQLVDVCSFGIVEGLDDDNLTTATVSLSDAVSTIVGNTDLSSFVTRSEFEAGLGLKQDILHYYTEDTDEGIGTMSSGGARIDVDSIDGGTTNIEGTHVEIHDLAGYNKVVVGNDNDKGVAVTTETGKKFTYNGVEVATTTDLAGKQDVLTFDDTPTYNSDNPVKSGGVYAAIQGITPTIDMDTTPQAGSMKPVTSSGIKTYVDTIAAGKQPLLTFDSTPTASSTNPVTSGGVYAALQNVQPQITIDPTPTMASPNPVSSGGVYSALQGVGNMVISAQSGTTLTAALNTYYVYSSAVSTLAITLPSISSATAVSGFVVSLTTSSSPSVTITASGGEDIYTYNGLIIAGNKEYELNLLWNGSKWIIAYGIIVEWT